MVTDWTMQHGQKEVVKLCGTAQVPCGIVAAIDEIFEDPHYAARENIVRVRSARAGEIAVPNVVPRLTGTPGSVEWLGRSAERRVGKECGSTCRSRWAP